MRIICLFLLMFIVNDFTHADEASFDVSLDCQNVEVQDVNSKSSTPEEDHQNHQDGHCHHGHIHIVTLSAGQSSVAVQTSFSGQSFPVLIFRSPKNILNEVLRPPIS